MPRSEGPMDTESALSGADGDADVEQSIGQLPLHGATGVFLCLRWLAPKAWWRTRALSRSWRGLVDGDSPLVAVSLFQALLEAQGPLRTANEEIDFAGCVYTAVHFGSAGALRCLLQPLTLPTGWARESFALGVAREALLQAALSGESAIVEALLTVYGPGSLVSSRRRALAKEDAVKTLKALQDWERHAPDLVTPDSRQVIQRVLLAVA
mmetsp:Transcript_108781/g.314099  ORF Transcript_108781/g.314099 Transcript_108781/m.314099 type:complete len:210 (+) Transcript_108781:43-672(+)